MRSEIEGPIKEVKRQYDSNEERMIDDILSNTLLMHYWTCSENVNGCGLPSAQHDTA